MNYKLLMKRKMMVLSFFLFLYRTTTQRLCRFLRRRTHPRVGTLLQRLSPRLARPRYPTSAERPAYRCSLPGLAGFGGQRELAEPFSSTSPTAGPVGQGLMTPLGFHRWIREPPPGLRPPHIDGFGFQGTPNPPA